jgi:hypothetical protein
MRLSDELKGHVPLVGMITIWLGRYPTVEVPDACV